MSLLLYFMRNLKYTIMLHMYGLQLTFSDIELNIENAPHLKDTFYPKAWVTNCEGVSKIH